MVISHLMNVRVASVRPDEAVQMAIARMLEENVGAVAVCEGPRLVGIFTERDVLRLAGQGADLRELKMDVVMTRRLVTAMPDDDVLAVAELMRKHRIRHLPVLEGENLLGIVGIREILVALVERLWSTPDERVHETARELLAREPARSSH